MKQKNVNKMFTSAKSANKEKRSLGASNYLIIFSHFSISHISSLGLNMMNWLKTKGDKDYLYMR